MKRYNDVFTLLDETKNQYDEIKKLYDKALQDKSLDIRIKVKNLMENLRSILDYISHDIYEIVCKDCKQIKLDRIYFPYGKNINDFKSSIGKSLPDLETLSPSIYKIIENIQPFILNNSWLYNLCFINNSNKHDRLTPQEREEIETYSVQGPHGSVSTIVNNPNIKVSSTPGAVKIFGVPAQFTPEGIKTAPSNLQHKRIIWVSFLFEGTNINVLKLLKDALPNIEFLTVTIYNELKKIRPQPFV